MNLGFKTVFKNTFYLDSISIWRTEWLHQRILYFHETRFDEQNEATKQLGGRR
jgi:hypothetical protein